MVRVLCELTRPDSALFDSSRHAHARNCAQLRHTHTHLPNCSTTFGAPLVVLSTRIRSNSPSLMRNLGTSVGKVQAGMCVGE
jgi:hypothetical protein